MNVILIEYLFYFNFLFYTFNFLFYTFNFLFYTFIFTLFIISFNLTQIIKYFYTFSHLKRPFYDPIHRQLEFNLDIRADDELVYMGFYNSDLLYLVSIKLIYEKY